MTSSRAFLKDLRAEIEADTAVNHLLLNRLATAPFSRQDYRIFAENHIPLVAVFTTYLEILLLRAPDSESRLWLAKVLVDEYGEGSDGKDHTTLYGSFLSATGGDVAAITAAPIPEPAHRFLEHHRTLVRAEPFLVGLGAIGPGHEWAIPKMFEAIIPGLRRAGFTEREIHYFTLHVEQDDEHGSWLEEALATYATTPEAQAQIRRGALSSLRARGEFWDGVQRAIVRYRQPRVIRQDGQHPRSIPRELLVTALDGFTATRRATTLLRRLRNGRRPNIAGVLERARELGS